MFGALGKKIKLPAIESRSLKYGYANARVKAIKGLLLSPVVLDELVRIRSLDGMVELLQRTPYRNDLSELAIRYKGSQLIELAAGQRFVRIAKKILQMTPPGDRPVVRALLKKWDLLLLRTVLNARRTGKKMEDIRAYLVPIDPAYKRDLETIAGAEDLLSGFRRTAIGQEVLASRLLPGTVRTRNSLHKRNSRKAMESGNGLIQIQSILDTYVYAYAQNAFAGIADRDVQRIQRLMQKEVDARNLVTIEKFRRKGASAATIRVHLLPGGTLSERVLARLFQSKNPGETRRLAEFHLGKLEGLDVSGSDFSLPDFEIALEKMLAREKVKAFHRSILSIGTLLGAILILEEEVHNLRKIAKAKEFGFGEEETRKTLVAL